MITFEYPYLLALLLPAIWCLYRCRQKLQIINFVHVELFNAKKRLFNLELFLKMLFVALLVIAISSPIRFDQTHPLNRHGKEIIISIDGSGSMGSSGMESDSFKSRFEINKELAKEFITSRYQDNFGVVYFGDFAFIASPITYERESLLQMIDYLNLGMAGQNTSIGDALMVSQRAFKMHKNNSKVIILLSDGEQNSGKYSIKDALKKIQDENIIVYTIGISDEVNEELLKKIASESHGEYFKVNTKEELKSVYEQISKLEDAKLRSKPLHVEQYYFHYFLIFAYLILLYLLYKGSEDRVS